MRKWRHREVNLLEVTQQDAVCPAPIPSPGPSAQAGLQKIWGAIHCQVCPGAAAWPGSPWHEEMGLLLLVPLLLLPGSYGLPFYNGFYYSNGANDQNPGNGHGKGVVFPYQSPNGRYQLNFHQGQQVCAEQSAVVASFEQLFRAWEEGLDWCNAGWLQDATVQYPIMLPRQPCGGPGLAPGVRSYGPRHRRLHRYDVFCFATALKGRVYYLEHPEKLTLTEAREACQEDDATIAKVGQLFAAWKFHGLDRCDAGWLADGSVRYPVVHPHPNCGPPEPGVRSFGFPDPQSRLYGVYCYRQH
ncbi:hyaluronan and proteoglycan link protein 3 isoform X6 [Symphalangus syndactylus]|uniref:hyaluronan and proteoglycan link protein 3 isoform X6 n=1 Tax=Symphalangus syndactylus TaxID=9590 RepID=UPI0030040B22